ncbi:hypothetical protein POM88_051240 [Heracleum sosnowskyi]|uniref:Uncharacterized protein n=1 Tax=Heracleum sosnowskyi TaxID=360622 RepID=A0AAD8H027_9APIA|nr:hypothetical protein POM88_051240 [Heracleum sosnowskyi]
MLVSPIPMVVFHYIQWDFHLQCQDFLFGKQWKIYNISTCYASPYAQWRDKSGVEGALALPGTKEQEWKSQSGFDIVQSGLLLRESDNGNCFSSRAVSEVEFVDLSDSLLNFPTEDELMGKTKWISLGRLAMKSPAMMTFSCLFIHQHLFPARKSYTTDPTDPASSADERDNERGLKLAKAIDSTVSHALSRAMRTHKLTGSFQSLSTDGCKVTSQIPDAKSLILKPGEVSKTIRDLTQYTADRVQKQDLVNVKSRVSDNP